MVVTQPRRIAATSIAARVADEMGAAPVGGLVGYQIGMKAERCAQTRLLFCTTGGGRAGRLQVASHSEQRVRVRMGCSGLGVRRLAGILLRRLVTGRLQALQEFTHIILDELHETTIDMAFVVTILKRSVPTAVDAPPDHPHAHPGFRLAAAALGAFECVRRRCDFCRRMLPEAGNVRVVLMSATLDADRLAHYFSHLPAAGGGGLPMQMTGGGGGGGSGGAWGGGGGTWGGGGGGGGRGDGSDWGSGGGAGQCWGCEAAG